MTSGFFAVAFALGAWFPARAQAFLRAFRRAVLIAFSFSAIGMAATTFMRSWADFEYVPAVLPLFLFSATFYPLSSYGDWAWVVQFSPLYHGVATMRGLNNGDLTWAMLAHIGVLVALAIGGLTLTARRIERLLLR